MRKQYKTKKTLDKSEKKCPLCGEMYVGLLLHLQRSECVPVAINANVLLTCQKID